MLGGRDTGIVTRDNGDPLDELLEGHLGTDSDKHFGAARTPGRLTDEDFVVQVNLPLLDGLEDEVETENLRE